MKMGPVVRGASTLTFVLIVAFSHVTLARDEHYLQASETLQIVCDAATPMDVSDQADLKLSEDSDVIVRGRSMGWRARFQTNNQNEFRVQRLAPGKRFRGARLEWWGNDRPQLLLSVGADCGLQAARRMEFDESGNPSAVVHLDQDLNDTDQQDLLNPSVPSGSETSGLSVALVDSGVNYLLPEIENRLARGQNGEILGYDFWGLDRKPFDANPARSPFFPQRHGTRSASLLLREVPDVLLVPYRYPRDDMTRMSQLLKDIDRHGIKVVGVPMGGSIRAEWETFAAVAGTMKDTLFVVSAGNSDTNIDFTSVYPASLELDNMIVVTSSDDSGQPAQGSNWGRLSVDLLIPAERQLVTDFYGNDTLASGSSYAVSRVAALAMRLLLENPAWTGAELKSSIFSRAIRQSFGEFVSIGYLPDPLAHEAEVGVSNLDVTETDSTRESDKLLLSLHVGLLQGSGWSRSELSAILAGVDKILGQCGVRLHNTHHFNLEVSDRLMDFSISGSHTLVTQAGLPTPTVFLVRDTTRTPAFDGEAFGRSNTHYREWLKNTIWLTSGISEPEVGLAHELVHVLSDSGAHSTTPGNLMQRKTSGGGVKLEEEQCQLLRSNGLEAGLIFQR